MKTELDRRTPRSRPARRGPLLLTALLGLGALGGCATQAHPFDELGGVEALRADSVDRIGSAMTGSRVPFTSERLPGVTAVIVGRPYAAASGHACRPLADTRGMALGRIVCESDGDWRLVRSLEPSGALRVGRFEPDRVSVESEPVVPVTDASFDVLPFGADGPPRTAEMVRRDLEPGETLWSFAERLTGEGERWRRIAALNGVDESVSNGPGRRLIVPVDLLRD